MKIAVSSQNFRTVTGHAGKSRRFLVFQVSDPSGPVQIGQLDLPMGQAFHDFAGGPHPLDGMDVIVTASAGQGFVAKMAERGIKVIATAETEPLLAVRDVLLGQVKPALAHDEDQAYAPHGESRHEGCCCSH